MKSRIIRISILSVLLLLLCTLIYFFKLSNAGSFMRNSGATVQDGIKLITKNSLAEQKDVLRNTPQKKRDPIIEDMGQADKALMLIFYKPNCPYCEASYETLITRLKDEQNANPLLKNKIAFVNTHSKVGIELAEKYDVTKASTTILKLDNKDNFQKFIHAGKDSEDHFYPEVEVIDNMFNILNETVNETLLEREVP